MSGRRLNHEPSSATRADETAFSLGVMTIAMTTREPGLDQPALVGQARHELPGARALTAPQVEVAG